MTINLNEVLSHLLLTLWTQRCSMGISIPTVLGKAEMPCLLISSAAGLLFPKAPTLRVQAIALSTYELSLHSSVRRRELITCGFTQNEQLP